jgi:hypothetical protein
MRDGVSGPRTRTVGRQRCYTGDASGPCVASDVRLLTRTIGPQPHPNSIEVFGEAAVRNTDR